MSRHVVRHIAVKEGEGFDLLPGERVISVDHDAPWFHLVLLLEAAQFDGQEATDGNG